MKSRRKLPRLAILTRLVEAVPHTIEHRIRLQRSLDLGWPPRSPKPEEPEFDLAWSTDVGVFVCEVKSLTVQNEEPQLRMAIGQVIRYRQKLAAAGHEPTTAVIATETTPADVSWDRLCQHEGILLIWPEVAKARIESAVATLHSCA